MQPQTILDKMREYIQDFRAQLAKKDRDALHTLTANTGSFFRELISELPETAVAGREVRIFADCVERFGTACSQDNWEAAAETLSDMEDIALVVQNQCSLR